MIIYICEAFLTVLNSSWLAVEVTKNWGQGMANGCQESEAL